MPQQRAAGTTSIGFYVNRELKKQAEKYAQKKGHNLSWLMVTLLTEAVSHIILSAEDHEQIAKEIRAYEQSIARRKKKR